MSTSSLSAFSDALAAAVDAASPSVVQVHGRRRPVSGVVFAADTVITTARALGRGDDLRVRTADNRALAAELAGWDPTTGLAVLRVPDLGSQAAPRSEAKARVGHVVLALARSWSNAITASTGIIAVIGGPLRTGRRHSIDEVIRVTAPMHDGFAGGPLLNTDGQVIGICTSSAIRGLAVVIPVAIAWKSASDVLQHGSPARGFLGVAGQQVRLSEKQATDVGRNEALLIVAVTPKSPAAEGNVLVGDVLLDFEGHEIRSPEQLLDQLTADRAGKPATLRLLRGGAAVEVKVTVGTRTA
jgi:S1-C subfamily serine protease